MNRDNLLIFGGTVFVFAAIFAYAWILMLMGVM